ncbi:MAG: shikimate dehydrogenase [Clostridia bacterium]|nr:shikimate dehydrogenase [Clostridia bacterium]
MKYGLIGETLGHSFSKDIHNMIGGYEYEPCALRPEELRVFMQKRDFKGINITNPYKRAVMEYIDVVDPDALAIGAVNTVVNKDGVLYGYNTDINGLCALIKRCGFDFNGAKVLICGTGATSRTAYAAAKKLGALNIVFLSRTEKSGSVTYERSYEEHADADYIINTTPCGTWPHIYGCAADVARFECLKGVVDVVYNPLRTELVMRSRSLGIKAEAGLYMLVAQAVCASEKFLLEHYVDSLTEVIYEKLLKKKENIVLTGMPGSGKSTLARVLSAKTGRPYYDTDLLIREKTGKYPHEIIAERGESEFRAIECEIIAEIAKTNGSIIATGGGAVLHEGNIRKLRMNGKIVFIDLPLEHLKAYNDRPLSSSKEKLAAMYKERMPLYVSRCDIRYAPCGSPEACASELLEELKI